MKNVNEVLTYLFSELKDGVEYKRLGDITEILRGRRLTKKELTDNAEYPVYHGGIEPIGYYSHHNRPANTVMIINVGASAGTVGYCNKPFWSSDGCYCIDKSELLSDRYLYYVLSKNQLAFVSKVRHAGIPTLDSKVIANFEIPVPPIEVQSKIVEILDNFTELEARRKQYEYYRNQLLTFDKVGGARFDIKWMKLGDLAELVTKQTGFDYTKTIRPSLLRIQEEDSIPYMQTKNFSGRVFDYNTDYYVPRKIVEQFPRIVLNKKCLLFSIVGASIGNVGLFPGTKECFLGGAICVIKFKDGVNIAYIYEIMSSWYGQQIIRKKTKGLGQATVTVEDIRNFVIPIPPLSEQERIVSILDRFEALTTDLQSGLPAEIEARRKQYEYYREKLLTFKRKTA